MVKLVLGGEQLPAAPRAQVCPFILRTVVPPGEGSLGALPPEDSILLGVQLSPPLLLGPLDLAPHRHPAVIWSAMFISIAPRPVRMLRPLIAAPPASFPYRPRRSLRSRPFPLRPTRAPVMGMPGDPRIQPSTIYDILLPFAPSKVTHMGADPSIEQMVALRGAPDKK